MGLQNGKLFRARSLEGFDRITGWTGEKEKVKRKREITESCLIRAILSKELANFVVANEYKTHGSFFPFPHFLRREEKTIINSHFDNILGNRQATSIESLPIYWKQVRRPTIYEGYSGRPAGEPVE